MTHRPNHSLLRQEAITHTEQYTVLPGVGRHTFIIFGLFTTPNLCPLRQNPGDATAHVVDIVIPESQCGFRRGRSTTDMMFVARLLQEKCREQHQSLFFAFIYLTKAFDTVNRELLWKVLSKFGCPPHFLQILRDFNDGMSARVTVGGHESDPFDVLVGVKQGCVLAPVIFNLLLVAVTLVFLNGLPPNAGIPINFRLVGSLFNIRRHAKTKISSDRPTIFDLQYADDAAIPNHTAAGLQDTLDILAAT